MPSGPPTSLCLPALTCIFLAASAQSQTLTLTTDHTTSPVRQVVNLTATLQGTPTPPASVTFYDGPTPIYTVPLSSIQNAVLSTASLPTGNHTLSARYTPAGSLTPIVSPPVALTITPLAAPFTVSTNTSTPFAGNPINVSTSGLPADATGTLQFSESGATLLSAPITGTQVPRYQAFGDSITYGATLPSSNDRYPTVIASALGLTLFNYALPGAIACDILPLQILRNPTQSTQASAPLSSLLIGSNDADFYGTGPYEPNFRACHQATLAWLAIPREYKVLPGDPAATPISGIWTHQPDAADSTYGTLYNSTGSGAARFSLTTSGAPLYLWHLIRDSLNGTFTLTIDGVPSPTIYSTQPTHFIGSILNPDQAGFALIRLPVPPGLHQVEIDVTSGTVGILGLGTAPTPGTASVHPTVLVGDLPLQLLSNPTATPSDQAQYTQDIRDDLSLLQADGLDLRSIPTGQFFHATPLEMNDQVHPSILGQSHLADAFRAAIPSTAPFASFVNTSVAAPLTFARPGTHVLDVSYSGDSIYAPSTYSLTLDILPKASTAVSLSTSATSALAGSPVVFSVTVVPAAAAGTISLWDGTRFLDQATVTSNGATFSITTLAPGVHSISALYSGDSFSLPSQSPPLTITTTLAPSSLTLAPLPAHLAFGTPLTLSATLLPATATGNITFNDSFFPSGSSPTQPLRTTLGQSPVVNGSAALTPPTLAPGTHTFSATYAGDAANTPSSSLNATVVVDPLPTTTTLAPIHTPLLYGAPATFTASVLPATSTGTIAFSDMSGTLAQVPISNGTATFISSTLPPGAHTITATYSGDSTHAPSTSATLLTQVNPAPSTTTFAPIAPTLTAGTALTLTTTITPATATGTVLFRDANAGTLGQASISAGTATLTLPSLPSATYAITAIYSGDPFTDPSTSATVSTRIVPGQTTTTLAPIPATLSYATPLNLTASISPASTTGSITFTDNGQPLATLTALNGSATFTTSTLPVGPHTLSASFTGNAVSAPSTSAPATLSVTAATTSTTLSLAQVNIPAGLPVVVNVRVASSSASIPSGTITLRSGSVILAQAPLTNGTPGQAYATVRAPAPATLGTFPVVALYSGDPNDAASDSSATPTAFTILPTPTTATLSLSATQVPPQTPITLTASFTSANTSVPTGTVTFLSGSAPLGTVPLDPTGKAALTLASRPMGAYSLSATLTPTGLFAPSATPAHTLTVTAPLTLALTASTLSIAPGATASTTLTLTPLSGFHGAIASTCHSPVPWVTCTLDSPTTLSTSPATATLHISVHPTMQDSIKTSTALALLLPFLLTRKRRRRLPTVLTLTLLLATLTSTLTGCAEGGTFGNIPPGTQLVQINVVAAGTTTTSQLIVSIQ